MALQFYFIRLSISHLGAPVYTAIAMTVALQAWGQLTDLGISAALQQRLAHFRDDADRCGSLIRNSWMVLTRAVLIFAPLSGVVAYFTADRYLDIVTGITIEEKRIGFAVGVSGLVIVAIGQTAQRALLGLGNGVSANLYLALNTLLSVGLGLLGGLLLPSYPLIGLACGYFLSGALLWWLVFWRLTVRYARSGDSINDVEDKKFLFRLAKESWLFLLLAAIILSLDYVILSLVCEQTDILKYNLANRLILPGFLIVSTLFSSYQSEATYAFTRGEGGNVLRCIYRIMAVGGSAITFLLLLVALAESRVLNWLAPGQSIQFGFGYIGILLLYFLIRVWTDGFTVIVVASGNTKKILPAVFAQAVISAPLQYFMGRQFGILGVIGALCICFLTTVSWYIPRRAYLLCRTQK